MTATLEVWVKLAEALRQKREVAPPASDDPPPPPKRKRRPA